MKWVFIIEPSDDNATNASLCVIRKFRRLIVPHNVPINGAAASYPSYILMLFLLQQFLSPTVPLTNVSCSSCNREYVYSRTSFCGFLSETAAALLSSPTGNPICFPHTIEDIRSANAVIYIIRYVLHSPKSELIMSFYGINYTSKLFFLFNKIYIQLNLHLA